MPSKTNLRAFYILILTQTFSVLGSRMTGLAIGIKVFNDTEKATPLAFAAFFAALPAVISSSFAGVLADRWDRRKVMAISDAGQAIGTLLLLITFATGTFEVWHLYVVALIQSIFGVFQSPAFGASMTMLVPDDHRNRANAIRQLIGPMSGIIAPALAGVLFVAIGVIGVMAFDLFTFAVAVIVVLSVYIPKPEQTAEGRAARGSIWKEIPTGLRFLRERRTLLAMVLYISLLNFLLTSAMVLHTPYVLTITDSAQVLGALMSVTSAAAIIGGVIMGAWGGSRARIHIIMPGIIITGLGLSCYGVSRHPITMGMALFIMMLPIPMINASFMSIMQIKTPPDIQGRVFATLEQLSLLLTPLALLMAGPLADRVFEPAVHRSGWDLVAPLVGQSAGAGIGLIMLINGSLVVLVSALVYAMPAMRRMEATLPDYTPTAAPEPEPEMVRQSEMEPAAANR